MTAALIAAAAAFAVLVAMAVPRALEEIARRRKVDADDEQQATAYWAHLASLVGPIDDDPETHAQRLATRDHHYATARAARRRHLGK